MWPEYLWDGLSEAIHLIVTGDPEIVEITLRTLQISFFAILMASAIGIPLGIIVGFKDLK
jgi:tungstate transport system permease protein